MKRLLLLTIFALCFISNIIAQNKKPNVLIFLVDDLRTDLGCYENNVVQSPNIDALSNEGVLFKNAYCQQSVCAPSRMSILTGLRPETFEIYDISTPFRPGHEDIVTMPQLFKENNYTTVSIGKVYHHSQDDVESWSIYFPKEPNAYVKPENIQRINHLKKEAKSKGLKGKTYTKYIKGPAFECADVADEAYKDGRSAKNAIETLHEIKDEKFFMVVGLSKPHLPFNAPKKYWDLYDRDALELPVKREAPKGMYPAALTNWGELRAYSNIPKKGALSDDLTKDLKHGYYACVSYIDAQVGKVMHTLEALDLDRNTIVVLMSDHGWKLGEYGAWCKHTNFELDVNVPLIIRREASYKNRVKNVKSNALVENIDVFPTLAEACGLKSPPTDGKSMLALINDPTLKWDKGAYSVYPRKGNKVMGCTSTDGEWRFTEWRNSQTQKVEDKELYRHKKGIRIETENFAGNPDFAAIEARMKQLLEEQFPPNRKSFYSTKETSAAKGSFIKWKNDFTFPNTKLPLSLHEMNGDIDEDGFIHSKDGHFMNKSGRVKFFGVNISSDGAFPENELADTIAEQLAASGVNCARIHFIDAKEIWGKGKKQNSFDKNQLDKLDYFLYALKKRGIYFNMNLHCGWNYYATDNFDYASFFRKNKLHKYGKGIDEWVPELIEMQKDYARNLLTHVNPYTNLSYAEDPAMALVEINNENSTMMQLYNRRTLNTLPVYLQQIMLGHLKNWVAGKYKNNIKEFRKVWEVENFDRIKIPIQKKGLSLKKEKQKDFAEFFRDLEGDYWKDMVAFLKEDLKVKVPITGTQLDHGYWSQSDHLDYVDDHIYWSQPKEKKNVNGNASWNTENISMIPEEVTTFQSVMSTRIKDKPFVVSEYNHGHPNQFFQEAPLLLAWLGSQQDIDGLFYFSHIVFLKNEGGVSAHEYRDMVTYYGQYLPAAALFRNPEIKPLEAEAVLPMSYADELEMAGNFQFRLSMYAPKRFDNSLIIPADNILSRRIYTKMVDEDKLHKPKEELAKYSWVPDDRTKWVRNKKNVAQSYFSFNDKQAAFLMGWSETLPQSIGKITVDNVKSSNGHFVFSAFNKDGDIGQAGRYVIQLLNGNRMENLSLTDSNATVKDITEFAYGEKIYATNKKEIRKQELVESVSGRILIHLDEVPKNVSVYAMHPNGEKKKIPFDIGSSEVYINFNKNYKSLIYMMEVDF